MFRAKAKNFFFDLTQCVSHPRSEEITPRLGMFRWNESGGSGKSAISLEIARIYAGSGRLLASYFFFRNAGDRSRMDRFAVTLASQLAAAVPTTASFIKAALKAEPGLLTHSVSLATRLERLVYRPFQAAVKRGLFAKNLTKGPFLIVVDGLDECDDKRGVEEFISHTLDFFKKHPSTPLRIFIASRVEQHIQAHLETDGVLVGNLDDYSPDEDINNFLHASFQIAEKQNPIIRAYIHGHGVWPTTQDMRMLVCHIRGSFVLASTIFKFIVQPATEEDPSTPMDRLPLTLGMNGLDGIYAQTLARSRHLPHFRDIISVIALKDPQSIVKIAELLDIQAFEIVHVLLNLQAIIHVPGSDERGDVTLCHTSLPSFHLHFSYYSFSICVKRSYVSWHSSSWQLFAKLGPGDFINEIEQLKARQPYVDRSLYHAFLSSSFFYSLFLDKMIPVSDAFAYLLTEITKQFALAAEYSASDSRLELWFDQRWCFPVPPYNLYQRVRFTEHVYKTLQHDLQRASIAIHAKFPEIIECQPHSTGKENESNIGRVDVVVFRWGTIDAFNALEWIVARAQCKWEELKETPRPPLELSLYYRSPSFRFSFNQQNMSDDFESPLISSSRSSVGR
ncbi:hypothetical protein H1R20_g9701, partial [Candolleomyces eurysporus]